MVKKCVFLPPQLSVGNSLLYMDEGYGADFRIVFGRYSWLEFQFRAAAGETFSFTQKMFVAMFGNANSFGRHPRERYFADFETILERAFFESEGSFEARGLLYGNAHLLAEVA